MRRFSYIQLSSMLSSSLSRLSKSFSLSITKFPSIERCLFYDLTIGNEKKKFQSGENCRKLFFAFIKLKMKKPTKITSAFGRLEMNLAHNKMSDPQRRSIINSISWKLIWNNWGWFISLPPKTYLLMIFQITSVNFRLFKLCFCGGRGGMLMTQELWYDIFP